MSKKGEFSAELAKQEAWKSIVRNFGAQVEAQATPEERVELDHTGGETGFFEDAIAFATRRAERFKPLLTELIQQLFTLSREKVFDLVHQGALTLDANGEVVVVTSESYGMPMGDRDDESRSDHAPQRIEQTYLVLTGPDAGKTRSSTDGPLWDVFAHNETDQKT